MATNSTQTRRLLQEMALNDAAIMARTKEARTTAGLTQEQVADALEVHVNSVSNWERRFIAPMKDMARLAPVIQTTVEWLLHGDDAPSEGLAGRVDELADRLDRMERMLQEVLRRLPEEEAPQ